MPWFPGTQYSMLFPPELSGSVSLNLKNTTVREALETLRDVYGYDYRFQGNRIYVQPNTIQTRLFKINYLANRRLGTSDMRCDRQLADDFQFRFALDCEHRPANGWHDGRHDQWYSSASGR